jgi:transposase
MQPVFHWTANRILSHIAVCFVAFSLIRFLQHIIRTETKECFSAARISEELWSVQESILTDPKKQKRYVLPAKTSKDTQTIYQAMKKTPKFSALSITRKLKSVVARCFGKSLSNSAL